jgi:hypothetical protein
MMAAAVVWLVTAVVALVFEHRAECELRRTRAEVVRLKNEARRHLDIFESIQQLAEACVRQTQTGRLIALRVSPIIASRLMRDIHPRCDAVSPYRQVVSGDLAAYLKTVGGEVRIEVEV